MTNSIKKNAIYVTRHGSHAYGLNTAASDLDIKGVLIGNPEHYLGFLNRIEQIEERDPNDLVIYEIQKFFRLAADCNPNIIEVLHTDANDVLYMNEFGEKLRGLAGKFLSTKAKHTFSGYAMAQMKRMRNHHEWMKNPPTQPKTRAELGLPQSKDWCAHLDRGDAGEISPEIAEKYNLERQWRKDSEAWAHFQEWLAGRNVKRHELEAKFGYDTKHGMHLVRLMRMGKEILTTGKVIVKRPDREELLAIRNQGIWSYDQIMDYATKMDAELTEIYKSGVSPLPKEPDRKALDATCSSMVELYLDRGYKFQTWDGKVSHEAQ